MITIKLIGGAKKSFNSEQLQIDKSNISVNKLLELLLKMKPDNTSNLDVENILIAIQETELSLGRNRTSEKGYQARTIDIDVLLFDNEIIFSKELIVPHKEMLKRKFVLVPLAEIAPNFIHPIEKQRISVCLENCTDNSPIEQLDLKLKILNG